MATVFEGLMSSRRRPSRSQSESGKQLHSRWGDASISAPNGGGWSQHYLEDDPDNVVYHAHGSPDSQKTLVSDSPDLSIKEDVGKVSIEELRQSTPPVNQKERGTITITIPLPWVRRSHRRSSSGAKQQAQAAQIVEKVVTAESRPPLPSLATSIDEVIVAESRPTPEVYRAVSPVVQTRSPVYDDVSTFFTRAIFPEKHPGPRSLPQIQTSVPINKSQPASALSILSPVAEKYNGMSESNNATPMDNTPIAHRIASAIDTTTEDFIDVSTLTERLAQQARHPSPSLPPSRVTSPIEAPIERPDSRSTANFPSRPASRGPGIGEVAYMRASSRGAAEHHDGRRSASREPLARRAPSADPVRRRAPSRDSGRRRADSPRAMSGRSYSKEAVGRGDAAREPTPAPAAIAEPAEPRAGRDLSMEPLRPRAESPGPATRRAHSRGASAGRDLSPARFSRRAISREPVTRHRFSGDFTRRAMSVDPIHRRASPREDMIPLRASPPLNMKRNEGDLSDSLPADDLTSDETTDIETETDEMYFESRKGWNGPAVTGATSRGFYNGVISDYKLIARDVEAEQTQGSGPKQPAIELVKLIKRDKFDMEVGKEVKKYGGPDMVPNQEELWG
ncbi:hypothetical protein G647_10013 [Cladophialophora carrionii CBS 160.54]|uniref:Uncharacterized protein n=1 Tax=Cladophialophora carrionii CBS 160.54 TaxID=1279043 RepID=V9DJ55_9EURO|nr:uncharacterized protein G647_10013 [Cladophialophora carrionii CBS 160.54]ETI26914.1 hypothetical protein G647_10013 [Cladophialophora carrionii CBS 160.54]